MGLFEYAIPSRVEFMWLVVSEEGATAHSQIGLNVAEVVCWLGGAWQTQ